MASSCGCGCYGALNCVPGPLQCAYQPADPSCYQNFPFYNGPCPPGPMPPSCRPYPPCRHCPPWWWEDECCDRPVPVEPAENANAAFTQHPLSMFAVSGPIHAENDCSIPLAPSVMNWDLFSLRNGEIVIRKSGTYLATCTVNLPPQQNINTRLSLLLDGKEVPGSAHSLISLPGAATPICLNAQAIVQTAPNRVLSLGTENPLDISCENPNLITLSLMRVS